MNFWWRSSRNKSRSRSSTITSSHSISSETIDDSNNDFVFPWIIEQRYGEALGARTRILHSWASKDKLGVGLYDMVHITQFDAYHNNEEIGEYFYLTGLPIYETDTCTKFIQTRLDPAYLTQNNDNNNTSNKITVIYCCTNFFRNVDIRIRYDSSGSIICSIIDLDTMQSKPMSLVQKNDGDDDDDEFWEEVLVSSLIRSVITNIDRCRKLPGLLELDPFETAKDVTQILTRLCNFLPRAMECGWDNTKNLNCTILHNYLTDSILGILSAYPHYNSFVISYLTKLIDANDLEENQFFYKIVICHIMVKSNRNDLELVNLIHETLDSLLLKLKSSNTSGEQAIDAFQLVNLITDLLNIQAEFLIDKEDYELALSVANFSTELSSDTFYSWFLLSKCYIHLKQYDKALFAINSMPYLPKSDPILQNLFSTGYLYQYYKRPLGDYDKGNVFITKNSKERFPNQLDSSEFHRLATNMKNWKDVDLKNAIFGRIVMAYNKTRKQGYIKDIWDETCLELGPIYGPQSENLVNFVSRQEVNSITDMSLLSTHSISKQLGWAHEQIFQLLMIIIEKIGWNSLLKLRAKVFVMEREYIQEAKEEALCHTNKLREKRLCERWLDQLFLTLYENLLISTATQENREIKYSGLEWELLGLTLLKTRNWNEAVACLRTSVMARFDIISCQNILQLYIDQQSVPVSERFDIDEDIIIDLLAKKMSYDARFYDTFQLVTLKILNKLAEHLGREVLQSKLRALPYSNLSFMKLADTFIAKISE